MKPGPVKPAQVIPLGSSSSLQYYPEFIDSTTAARLLTQWKTELDWVQSEISLFGKKHPIPRVNAWYGDKAYAYSGTRLAAKPWTPELESIKNHIELNSGLQFNSVLVNWYRSGQDSMGWHSDNEKCLGGKPQIASVSFGDSRRFVLREQREKSNKTEITLEDRSLLLMLGAVQSEWQHSVPKTAKLKRDRINLTFRMIY